MIGCPNWSVKITTKTLLALAVFYTGPLQSAPGDKGAVTENRCLCSLGNNEVCAGQSGATEAIISRYRAFPITPAGICFQSQQTAAMGRKRTVR